MQWTTAWQRWRDLFRWLAQTSRWHVPGRRSGVFAVVTEALELGSATMALRPDTPAGQLHMWGANHLGQAGNGPGPDVLQPRPVPGLPAVSAACCNANAALALDQAGRVWSWGWDVGGMLGRATPNGRRVSLLDGSEESSAARPKTSLPPFASPGQVRYLPPIVQLVIGAENGLALDGRGRVWAWGGPACLGRPDVGPSQPVNAEPAWIESLPPIRSLACDPSGMAAYAVDLEGGLWSWGVGLEGELGRGKPRFDPQPGRVEGLGAVRSVHPGVSFCLALLDDGSVWGWGLDCGLGFASSEEDTPAVSSPTRVSVVADVQQLWVGGDMAILRTRSGETFSIGRSSPMLSPREPAPLTAALQRQSVLDPYRRFTLGRHHGFGVDAWGNVIGFGHAVSGALGNGLNRAELKLGPTRLSLRSLPLAAAGHHSLGLQ